MIIFTANRTDPLNNSTMKKKKLPVWLQVFDDAIPKAVRNRYFIVLALFFGWMIFFDRGNLFTQLKLANAAEELQEERVRFEQQIEAAKAQRLELSINKERFGREKYFLQKPNEEVFIMKKVE